MPAHRVLDVERVARAVRMLPAATGRRPTTADLAAILGASRPTIRKYWLQAIKDGLLEPDLPATQEPTPGS